MVTRPAGPALAFGTHPAYLVKMAHHIGFQGPERWTRKPNKSAYISDPGTKTPSQTFIPTDLKSKIVDGDYAALTQARNQNLNDLQPNMTTIQNASSYSDAFVTVTNESNNQDYLMCASDAGWIWTYTTQISYSSNDSSKSNTGDNTTTQCVIQSGTYSKNGNILGLSYQTLESVPTQITALAASVIVASIVFNYVKGYIADTVFETALSAALAAAAEEAVVGGFMANAAAASIVATIGAGLAAGVIGAVIAVVIFYLADVLHRSYGLTLTVFNWDPKFAWDVISWYGDNAVVSQESAADGPWRAASLRPVQSKFSSFGNEARLKTQTDSVPGPFGPVASKNNPVAQYASYAYANST